MYDTELADVYDAIYRGRGKDYPAEAAQVHGLITARKADATDLLDVASGTGAHLGPFTELFGHVEGLELSEAMVRISSDRFPEVTVHQGDMREFDLGRTFHAVTCMFSSIGYMADQDELDRALAAFARHTEPGGVIVIEPWWTPEKFLDGYVGGDVVRVDGRTIARVSHSRREGDYTHMDVHYTVAEPDKGIEHFTDTHVITLFTREQYETAFERAGCVVEFVEGGPSGRGLFVGVVK
ncbi:class I SAM-dependent methyltransferase [Crossiella sp. SN42]|uniref:class I SAM-dependent DNA methyltransferase n=1 Tax=Crossiella sp. SN42 TaxID=2944808 RepID=UPI00207D03B3|nr:class I SAM-dependent methyltransferase [Crossiella sp. SN42]MCO1574791.1 class I SAM-dependent methyltransferase [Crossiella sp. SN42]